MRRGSQRRAGEGRRGAGSTCRRGAVCRGSARFVSRCRGELSGRSLALLRERPFPKSALKRVWRRKAMRQVQSLPASEACVPPSPIPLLVPFHAHLCCDAGGVSQQKKVKFYTHQVRTSELAEVKLSHVLAANAAPGPSSRSHAKGPEESSGASTLPPGPAQPPAVPDARTQRNTLLLPVPSRSRSRRQKQNEHNGRIGTVLHLPEPMRRRHNPRALLC